MKGNKLLLYTVGAVIVALLIHGIYRMTRNVEDAHVVSGQANGEPPTAGAPVPAPETSDDWKLRVVDGMAAGITRASVTGGECWLDYFAQGGNAVEGGVISNGLSTQFYGWGLPGAAAGTIQEALIEFKPLAGEQTPDGFLRVEHGVLREDISRTKGSANYRNSGIYREGLLEGVEKGKYRLYLVMKTSEQVIQCDLNRDIEVR